MIVAVHVTKSHAQTNVDVEGGEEGMRGPHLQNADRTPLCWLLVVGRRSCCLCMGCRNAEIEARPQFTQQVATVAREPDIYAVQTQQATQGPEKQATNYVH